MDASNPVIDSSKRRVKDIINDVVTRRKQDLRFLSTVVSGAPRVYLSSLARRTEGDGVLESEMQAFEQALPTVDPSPIPEEQLHQFLRDRGECPVSGLMLEGRPIHTPGVHQKGGSVLASRNFGGSQIDREFVRRMLEYRRLDDFSEDVVTVYTRGTASGFLSRLRTLTSRKVPATSKALSFSKKKMLLTFQELLPVDPQTLMDRAVTWHADLAEQLDELRVSSKSGAGPPYWVAKPQALKTMLDGVLPLLHKAISEGKLGDLRNEQPELFLGEVKNKLDRYDVAKLADKTRPYFALPFHFQALFSMMSQPFTDALQLFHSGQGCNAYGFSWAHGGGAKMLEWAREVKDLEKGGRPRFCVYGDDVDIYYRTKGVLYRISPDFKQMDGSVDADIISHAIDYVYQTLSRVWGENPFFRQVAELWKEFATDPSFLIHGTKVWQKTQKDGLMTGVVGTTFFDTAKSAFAYNEWANQIECGSRQLLEEKSAVAFFSQKFGLVVKEGTWVPSRVQEEPIPGVLVSENKFLGMMMMYRGGPHEIEPVPYLPEDEWTNLLMVPRDDPVNFRRGRPKDSQLIVSRRWYDRARGYMVTGAFSNPLIRDWIHGFVNGLDPVSVVMSVQQGDGRGEYPPDLFLPPGTFEWPDSSGFPTERWCENLYFSPDNQWEDARWEHLFPTLETRLKEFREAHKAMRPVLSVLEVASGHPEQKGIVHAAQQVVEWTDESPHVDYSKEVDRMDPISGPDSKPPRKTPNPRSKILDLSPGKPPVERPVIPTQAEVFARLFETRKRPVAAPRWELGREPSAAWQELTAVGKEVGFSVYSTPIMTVREASQELGLSPERTMDLAREVGFYVLGRMEKFITKIRLITGDPVLQKQQAKQEAQNLEVVSVISKKTTPVSRVLKHKLPAEPLTVVVVRNEHAAPPPISTRTKWRGSSSAANSLNELFQANALVMRIRSRNVVRKGQPQQVETELAWRPAKLNVPPVWFMRAIGAGTRPNVRDLYDAVVAFFGMHEMKAISHSGWTIDPCAEPKPPASWADEVQAEERARLVDERGRVFSIRGPFLCTDQPPGPWCTIDQGKAVLEGVRWKQRKRETLSHFIGRTVKRLATHGLCVSHQT